MVGLVIGHHRSFRFSDWSVPSSWIRVSKPLHLCIIERPWLSLCWHTLSKIIERPIAIGEGINLMDSNECNDSSLNGFSFSFVASRLAEWNDEMIVCCKCLDGGSRGYTRVWTGALTAATSERLECKWGNYLLPPHSSHWPVTSR